MLFSFFLKTFLILFEKQQSEDVSMEALRKICIALNCNIADIVEFVPDVSPDYGTENDVE